MWKVIGGSSPVAITNQTFDQKFPFEAMFPDSNVPYFSTYCKCNIRFVCFRVFTVGLNRDITVPVAGPFCCSCLSESPCWLSSVRTTCRTTLFSLKKYAVGKKFIKHVSRAYTLTLLHEKWQVLKIVKGTVSQDGFGFWWHAWPVLGLNRGRGQFLNFKGSLTRDFRSQFFFMYQCPPGPQVFHWGRFEFFRKFAEIFAN
jgi:hypothetical protein